MLGSIQMNKVCCLRKCKGSNRTRMDGVMDKSLYVLGAAPEIPLRSHHQHAAGDRGGIEKSSATGRPVKAAINPVRWPRNIYRFLGLSMSRAGRSTKIKHSTAAPIAAAKANAARVPWGKDESLS